MGGLSEIFCEAFPPIQKLEASEIQSVVDISVGDVVVDMSVGDVDPEDL